MNHRLLVPVAGIALFLTGCGPQNNQSAQQSPPPRQFGPGMARGEVHRNAFESMQDPPINADTHFAAGELAESKKNPQLAVEQYQDALKLNPNHLNSLYRLGCVYAELKNYPDAIAIWRRYTEATDSSATGYSNLAFCEELAGRPEAAEADYQRGLKKDPASEPCRVNYGLMLARFGRISEATIQLQAVLRPAEVHYNLASVYELQGRREQAKAEYQKALDLDPGFNDAKSKLASLN